jgi:hypothetical protein
MTDCREAHPHEHQQPTAAAAAAAAAAATTDLSHLLWTSSLGKVTTRHTCIMHPLAESNQLLLQYSIMQYSIMQYSIMQYSSSSAAVQHQE